MSRDRQSSEREHWAPQLRRAALVALLAIVASSLLPLVHGAVSHLGDCGVCSVFAHNGASVADVDSQPDHRPVASRPEIAEREPVPALPRPAFERRSARAPPATSVSI